MIFKETALERAAKWGLVLFFVVIVLAVVVG